MSTRVTGPGDDVLAIYKKVKNKGVDAFHKELARQGFDIKGSPEGLTKEEAKTIWTFAENDMKNTINIQVSNSCKTYPTAHEANRTQKKEIFDEYMSKNKVEFPALGAPNSYNGLSAQEKFKKYLDTRKTFNNMISYMKAKGLTESEIFEFSVPYRMKADSENSKRKAAEANENEFDRVKACYDLAKTVADTTARKPNRFTGKTPTHNDVLKAELKRQLKEYGIHPSNSNTSYDSMVNTIYLTMSKQAEGYAGKINDLVKIDERNALQRVWDDPGGKKVITVGGAIIARKIAGVRVVVE